MKALFLIIVFLHGLIHLLGFVKGFGIKEVKELTLPISKPLGLLWLTATAIFLTFGVLHYANYKYAWFVGLLAVLLSQTLIIIIWKDARFGIIPNILILLVVIISIGHYSFNNLVKKDIREIIAQNKKIKEKTITENDITELPEPVKKWLRTSGVIGKPFINVGKVKQKAEIKMDPDQVNWLPATAIQYTTIENPAFIWKVDVKMNALLNFQGRDKFENGNGEMLIKMNSIINVVNEQGEKLNEGTLQRYLGEMVWFPSLALSHHISWEQINDNTSKATMNYKGTKGSGTFYFNSDGDFTKFSAMRYRGNEIDSKKQEWILLVSEHRIFEGIKVPTKMTATWKLEKQDWTWLKLEITDIKYNENVDYK